jgi:hypothetical protein
MHYYLHHLVLALSVLSNCYTVSSIMFLPCACLVLLLSYPLLWLPRLLYCLFFLCFCVGRGISCIHRAMSLHCYVCGLSPVDLFVLFVEGSLCPVGHACMLLVLSLCFFASIVFCWLSCCLLVSLYVACCLLSAFVVGSSVAHVQSLWFSLSIARSNRTFDLVIFCAFTVLPFLYCSYMWFLSCMSNSGPLSCICIVSSPAWVHIHGLLLVCLALLVVSLFYFMPLICSLYLI